MADRRPREGQGSSGTEYLRSLTRRLALGAAVWSIATNVVTAQPGPGAYTAMIEGICRQYATAQTGMPADRMFAQCMTERRCRRSYGPSGYQCEMPVPMTWHGGGY